MNKKSTLLVVVLLCCFGLMYAQDNAIKQDKSRINSNVVKVENSISDSLNNNLAMFFDNFSIGLNYGISEFNGDIKEKGFLNKSNRNNVFNVRVGKEINNIFTFYTGFMYGALNGSRKKESYLDSEYPYDPYGNSDSLSIGEKFTTDFIELDLITSINIKNLLQYYYKSYPDNPEFLNRIDFFYNIGLGIMSFNSIKRNTESNTYIYAYGYHDLDGSFEDEKKLMERPLARVLIYGYNISYLINKNIKCTLFFTGRLADSDFLDSSMMSQQNDKYRHISLGLDYIF